MILSYHSKEERGAGRKGRKEVLETGNPKSEF